MSEFPESSQFLFPFATGGESVFPDRELMGIKGANLIEMARLGLPVPPGFVLATSLGREVASSGT